jgi:hypothetical protein
MSAATRPPTAAAAAWRGGSARSPPFSRGGGGTQAELAERISKLLQCGMSPKDSELYFATFLETMR